MTLIRCRCQCRILIVTTSFRCRFDVEIVAICKVSVKLEGPELLKLSIAADKLSLQSLIPRIEEYLIKNQHEFLQKNPMGILEIIYQHESFTKLWNFHLEQICENPKMLFNSDEFISIKAPLLELLLKRDDLSLEEIEIWDNLIKWSFAQNPSIPKDVFEKVFDYYRKICLTTSRHFIWHRIRN